ncbi:MAG: alanine--tRNA ligase [Elusimicrobia bacterium]|nr:alanine--tRNA ligase [Elusimicrobiota bacterium]
MTSNELRKAFLEFFKKNGHHVISSDSLIPSSDPTLLFSSAGMVQFKKYFLGEDKMSPPRAVSCQKCFRTSDLDQIGYTARHLSFFEMLGNFSFGDYFKKEAIAWGWEFLTKVAKLPENKLYITVYKDDNEALELWSKIVSKERIYKLGDDTNFWTMGPAGPCGPCSEILFDNGKELGCGKPDCSPACSCDRWLEIWNLVFTQFDRSESGELKPLAAKNIDTGMGLERLSRAVNNKKTVFETDLFFPVIQELEKLFACKYGKNPKTDTSLNIISDHIRSITFLISDGILPSNEGRGYVLRRLIRRALRQGKLLGYDKPFLYKLSNKVIEMMKDSYSELPLRRENIAAVTKMEEEKFIETLDTGLNLLNGLIDKSKSGDKAISGKDVFNLYDTFGFPKELTKEILDEHGITFNEKDFISAQESARDIAKSSWKGVTVADTGVYKKLNTTKFTGYETLTSESIIKNIIKDGKETNTINEKDFAEIVLDVTPFYAESGGQVGDTGILKSSFSTANVLDTKKPVENVIIHKIQVEKGAFSVGDKINAQVNTENRKNIMRHHTSTHLLHKALRTVLGEHATQSGSMVAPDRFRFDFVHFKAIDDRELERIEQLVNEKVMECLNVNTCITTLKKAKEFNATALFGEKYKEDVRCVFVGDNIESAYSAELCGGTHCKNTGEIGLFKILSETSVGSGVRRIEGVCGTMALKFVSDNEFVLSAISQKLKASRKELQKRVDQLISQEKQLEKEIEKIRTQSGSADTNSGQSEFKLKNNVRLIVQNLADPNLQAKSLRTILDNAKDKNKVNAVVMVINSAEDKISFVISATKDVIESGIDVSKPAAEFAKLIDGSAGGRKDFAQGGGKDLSKLQSAIDKLKDLF